MKTPTVLTQLLLEATDSIRTGHFQLSSGLHTDTYIQCAQLFQFPKFSTLVAELVQPLLKPFEVVVGPAYGGIIFSHVLGHLGNTRAIFAERVNGVLELRRGFQIYPGEKVLISEDVITTGKSTQEVVELVALHGGNVVQAVSVVNRGRHNLTVPVTSLLTIEGNQWLPEDCTLCKTNVPLQKPGSRVSA